MAVGGYRYSPPSHPPQYPYPGYTPPPYPCTELSCTGPTPGPNSAVGLKSVGQLTLEAVFSGLQGITEVYNLLGTGRINNHFLIPGIE